MTEALVSGFFNVRRQLALFAPIYKVHFKTPSLILKINKTP
jgi:hypothetical protein